MDGSPAVSDPVPARRQHIKILLLGESGVGKSAIVNRLTTNSFDPRFSTTVGVDFRVIEAVLGGQVWKIQLWDTAGQEKFRTITKGYFRSADGIMLVFDLTDPLSFDAVRIWLEQISETAPDHVSIMLIGNKTDEPRKVTREQAEALVADQPGLVYAEMSAKSGENVHDSVVELVAQIYERLQSEWEAHDAEASGPRRADAPISLTPEQAQRYVQAGGGGGAQHSCC